MVMTMVAMLTMPTTDGDAMIDGDGDDAGGDADDADGQCDYPRCWLSMAMRWTVLSISSSMPKPASTVSLALSCLKFAWYTY